MSHGFFPLEKGVPQNVLHFSLDGDPCFIQINSHILENWDALAQLHFSFCLSFRITANIWRINSIFQTKYFCCFSYNSIKQDRRCKKQKQTQTVLSTHCFQIQMWTTTTSTLESPACLWLPSLGVPSKPAHRHTAVHSCYTELMAFNSHGKIFPWLTRPCMRERKILSQIHQSERVCNV